jgi:hypothetical protein
MHFISKNINLIKKRENIIFVCRCHDLGNTDLWDKIHLLFKAAIDNEDMSPEIVDKCFGIANRSLLWGLYQLDIQFDKVISHKNQI